MKATNFRLGDWDFKLLFGGEAGSADAPQFNEKGVKATLDYLTAHQVKLQPQILAAAKKEYDRAVEDIEAFDPEDIDELLPPVNNNADLAKLLVPRSLNIFKTTAGPLHYVGLEFDCTWDEEHGVGVLLYKNRVVKQGGADVAFLEWIAERDAGSDNHS